MNDQPVQDVSASQASHPPVTPLPTAQDSYLTQPVNPPAQAGQTAYPTQAGQPPVMPVQPAQGNFQAQPLNSPVAPVQPAQISNRDPYASMAIAGFVIGLISIILGSRVYMIIISIVGFVFSMLGRKSTTQKGLATAGLVLSAIAFTFTVLVIITMLTSRGRSFFFF